jgi:phospholipase/carboxylesterase
MSEREIQAVELGGWQLKVSLPDGGGPHSMALLVHGWTGDENSMWVFANRLPGNVALVAPRALYASTHPKYGGYSWVAEQSEEWSSLDDFRPAVTALDGLLGLLEDTYPVDVSRFDLMGFSQGAVLCYAYTLLNPGRVARLAGLAGFLPDRFENAATGRPLDGLPVFIAHGTKDETVPVERARRAAGVLRGAGAAVEYCESEVGHKLGSNCFKLLKEFFAGA